MDGSFGFTEMSPFGESNNTVPNFNATITDDNDLEENFTNYYDYYSYDPGNNTYVTHMSVIKYMQQCVSIFGVIANALIITVMTCRNLKYPSYAILLSLAVADVIVLSSEIFINLTNFPLYSFCNYYYACAVALRVCDELNIIGHLTSTWLTVVVAVWRLMSLRYPGPTAPWRSSKRASVAIASTFAACIMIEAPRFWFMAVVTENYDDFFLYIVIDNESYIERWSQWVDAYQIFFMTVRISACVLLTALTLALMWSLYKANKKTKALKLPSEGDDRYDRITKMLIVVMVVFLLTNVPRAVQYLIHSLTDDMFLKMLIDEILVFLSIVNSSVNFIIYYFISSVFREAFFSILTRCKSKLCRCMYVPA